MSETKKIKYKCKHCGFTKIEEYAHNSIAEVVQRCPECNKIQFEQVIPTYFEQMKEKLNDSKL